MSNSDHRLVKSWVMPCQNYIITKFWLVKIIHILSTFKILSSDFYLFIYLSFLSSISLHRPCVLCVPFCCLAVQRGGSGCVEASRAPPDHWPQSFLEITILTRVIRHAQTKWPPVKHYTKSIRVSWNISQGNKTGIRVKASEYLLRADWFVQEIEIDVALTEYKSMLAITDVSEHVLSWVFLETKASVFFEQHNCGVFKDP